MINLEVRQKLNAPDPIVEAVRQKLLERAHAGLMKYGCTMERDDLELDDWLNHLQEELLDASVYIQRLIRDLREIRSLMESTDMKSLLHREGHG